MLETTTVVAKTEQAAMDSSATSEDGGGGGGTSASTTTTTTTTTATTMTTTQPSAIVEKRLRYQPNETSCMYRRNSLRQGRKSHHSVTKRMYDKFRKHTNKWLKENGLTVDCIDDWLLGENLTGSTSAAAAAAAGGSGGQVKTVCVKENWPKRTPYHVYYRLLEFFL
jgi:hypothetical protein